MHTTASDGTSAPGLLVRRLEKMRFTHAAITDHDTMAGIDEAADFGKMCDVHVIPGIELSADAGTEVHVLGYGVRQTEEALLTMKALREEREARICAMVSKLTGIGIQITETEVYSQAPGIAGRVHVARVLVHKNYVPDIKEAFKRYLAPGKVGFVQREKMTAREAVQWITRQGGIAVLAHPGLIPLAECDIREIIASLIDAGLSGIEAYHPGHSDRQCAHFDALGRSLSLLITGGSDFHGDNETFEPGFRLNRWKKMDEDLLELFHKIPIRE